ncbi:thioesterase domain-containing protein [Chryseobacterium sp. MYb264]|uniref:thioesterase II family protein n=1 Tax=Chryseobacterium sp. MYb264 TaxID=2745153 RepID=UPI002E144CDD|nr:thioesterase domain-containing protein [Chryseobacterium sp. MYb264]
MNHLQKWFPFNHRKILEENEKGNTFRHSEERIQVFCFPSAGSSAGLYRAWCEATKNNEEIDFIPVEIPGRGNHISSPAARSINELTEAFLEVFPEVVRAPYIIYGHSFGAAVAFQVAYALQEKGFRLPEKLIVAGRHAPHMKDPNPLSSTSTDAEIIEEIKKMGGTPAAILNHPEMLQFTLSQLRADLRTHESLRYVGQQLHIPIEAHCATQDDAHKAIVEYWKDVTTEEFKIKEFEGHHFFIQALGNQYLNELMDTVYQTKKSLF